MYLSSGFKAFHVHLMLASFIIYNGVFTNAKEGFVVLKGVYVNPPMFHEESMSLDRCIEKTKYPSLITCFLTYSPTSRICSFYVARKCNPPVVESRSKEDTTVYMRTIYTSSSSTVDPTSKSSPVAPTLTSEAYSSAATISASASTTFLPQTSLTQILSSDLVPTSSDVVLSDLISSHIAPTSTVMVSDLLFTSPLVTSYQETITTSIEISVSTEPIMTELSSDLFEGTPSFPTSILPTLPSESIPVSNFSEEVSGETTVRPSLCTSKVPMSSDYQCKYKCYQEPTGEELEKTIASIRKELTVNKSTLSRTIRSKTSAPDDRPSSTCIGMIGIVIMVSIFALLVISDIPQLYQHAKILKQNLLSNAK